MSLIQTIARGSRDLPHVGPHMGTPFALIMGTMTILAGLSSRGVPGALFATVFSVVFYGGLFCMGAVSRARGSDILERKARAAAALRESEERNRTTAGCVIEIRDGQVRVSGTPLEHGPLKGVVELRISGTAPVSVITDASVYCDDIAGDVTAGGTVSCGDIGGSVTAPACDQVRRTRQP